MQHYYDIYINFTFLLIYTFLLILNIIEPFQTLFLTVFSLSTCMLLYDYQKYCISLLSSFGNPVIILLSFLCFFGQQFKNSDYLIVIRNQIHKIPNKYGQFLVFNLSIGFFSAFLNNSVIVGLAIPILQLDNTPNNKNGLQGKYIYLILSFISILGGTLTLIGSSTNLIGQQLALPEVYISNFKPFLVGLPSFFIGLIYTCCVYFLNYYKDSSKQLNITCCNMCVSEEDYLIGKKVKDLKIQNIKGFQLIGLYRRNLFTIIPIRSFNYIQKEDILIYLGNKSDESIFKETYPINNLISYKHNNGLDFLEGNISIGRVGFLSPQNYKINQIYLKKKYNLILLLIKRKNNWISKNLMNIEIKRGDILIFYGLNGVDNLIWKSNLLCQRVNIVSYTKTICNTSNKKDLFIFSTLIIPLIISSSTNLPTLGLFSSSLLFLFLSKHVSYMDYGMSIKRNYNILGGTALSLVLAKSLELSGCLNILANSTDYLFKLPSLWLYFCLHLLISLISSVISNASVVSLFVPMIKTIDLNNNQNIVKLILCIIHASNCCFSNPLGYHTNLMVSEIGGYQFSDFFLIGIPLNIITSFIYAVSLEYLI